MKQIKSIFHGLTLQITKNVRKQQKEQGDYFQDQIEKLNYRINQNKNLLKERNEFIESNREKIEILDKKILSQRQEKSTPKATKINLLAYNHELDDFYVEFEKYFRGSEEDILKRQKVYLEYFSNIKALNKPVLDIGCGRGEFLKLIKDVAGLEVIGIDLNKTMVKRCKENGVKAYADDALSYLSLQRMSSLSAITGFHIVEHIPFDELYNIFSECLRTLKKGGFVLFETPNPENVQVGSNRFYNDPSHLHPIPPLVLEFMLKHVGFKDTKIIRLHPERSKNAIKNSAEGNELLQSIAEIMYAHQDYAVIGYR